MEAEGELWNEECAIPKSEIRIPHCASQRVVDSATTKRGPPTLPLFGISGYSGAGKTALLETLLPRLRRKGLAVAVLKHDIHGLETDRPGKDSDRLFRSDADVLVEGPDETFIRLHGRTGCDPRTFSASAFERHDLVLVEGWKEARIPKVWLLRPGESEPPPGVGEVLASLPPGPNRVGAVMDLLDGWLSRQWLKTPVFGCILIGGKSSRMGAPKHLIRTDGRTWLERTVELLKPVTDCVVVAGDGKMPDGMEGVLHLPDVPGVQGPMAGVLSAMRWAPHASWLIAACDLPRLCPAALQWLLSTRAPGVWATLPKLPDRPGVEPLLAHYDFRARVLVEDLLAAGELRLQRLSESPKVITPSPDTSLADAWTNVNTPAEL